MKTYEVELRRTSFITVTVEALNVHAAEELALSEYEWDDAAHWETESIEEVKE